MCQSNCNNRTASLRLLAKQTGKNMSWSRSPWGTNERGSRQYPTQRLFCHWVVVVCCTETHEKSREKTRPNRKTNTAEGQKRFMSFNQECCCYKRYKKITNGHSLSVKTQPWVRFRIERQTAFITRFILKNSGQVWGEKIQSDISGCVKQTWMMFGHSCGRV